MTQSPDCPIRHSGADRATGGRGSHTAGAEPSFGAAAGHRS